MVPILQPLAIRFRVALVASFALAWPASVAAQTQAVTSLTLINADTDKPVAGFNPIPNGATIDLAALPTLHLNIRANTNPSTVGSVRFRLDATTNFRTDNSGITDGSSPSTQRRSSRW